MSDTELVPTETGSFDLARTDGVAALKHAEVMIQYLAQKCKGPQFISIIQGRKYPRVEWWTTVGAGLGLFPQEESCVKLDRESEIIYEATVGVYRGEQRVSRGSAICSSKEKTWKSRDEYAVRSMALTRATGKAYRMAFSFLAVMAGLEPTPAEEMPEGTEKADPTGDDGKSPPTEEETALKERLEVLLASAEGRVSGDAIQQVRDNLKAHPTAYKWMHKVIPALEEEIKRQEALLAANAKPEALPEKPSEVEQAMDKLKAAAGAKAGELDIF